MEPGPKNPSAAAGSVIPADSELTPLSIIRTETVLSKFPVHNLAKTGRVDIQILKAGSKGEIELRWEVSYSERYGQARQLAYKLDTIVVDQRIDEAGRPLPERICLGSLNQIAQDLGLAADHGTTNKNLKRAFRQNALAGITAKFHYKGNDGTERTLEATFTRYSVIFTGEKLSDGRRADAVYLELNPTYREVLNNAPVRPLNFEYKKQLPPAAQRFYEIVSYKIFAALKYGQPLARLTYSEYCTFSAQQRYFDYDHFKKQMYKVHRPHLASGYLARVSYEQTTDEQGKADWIMCYTPGAKARVEYTTFTGKRTRTVDRSEAPAQLSNVDAVTPERRPRQRRLNLAPEPEESKRPVVIDYRIIAELAKRGVGESDARELLASLPPGQQVIDQLEWGDYQIQHSRTPITNPPGFYISLLQRNVPVPSTFETSAARKTRQEAEFAQAEALEKQRETLQAAADAERAGLEAQIDALPQEAQQQLYLQASTDFYGQYPHLAGVAKAHPDSAIHDGPIQARMRSLIAGGWKPQQTMNPAVRQAGRLEELQPTEPAATELQLVLADLRQIMGRLLLPAAVEPVERGVAAPSDDSELL